MSLKITVEVDGQSEQQMMPIVAQFVAWQSAQSKAQTDVEDKPADGRSHELGDRLGFYHDNSALLQQHIQQLAQQNRLLQAQLSQNQSQQQQRLAGAPAAKALPPAEPSASTLSAEVTVEADAPASPPMSTPPMLPAQYRTGKGVRVRRRLGRWLRSRWRQAAPHQQRLLLFLMMCGLTYGVLSRLPRLVEQLWRTPEFVDSAKRLPGDVATPDSQQNGQPKESETDAPAQPKAPASPTSKAGSHPPPPPAFQQP